MGWNRRKPKNWKLVLIKLKSEYWNEVYYTVGFYIAKRTEFAERSKIEWESCAIDYDDISELAYIEEGWYTILHIDNNKDIYKLEDTVLGWQSIDGSDDE